MSTTYCADCEPSCRGHSSYEVNDKPLRPDPSKFKQPHTWATFITTRSAADHFKTHSSAGVAKLSLRASWGYAQKKNVTMYVYEWDSETASWEERGEFPPGVDLDGHPFFQTKHSVKVTGPSDKAVAKTIASILESAS